MDLLAAITYFGLPVIAAFSLLAYGAGCFAPVKFYQRPIERFWFAYITHVGPYHTIGNTFEEVLKKANVLKLQEELWDTRSCKSNANTPPMAAVYFDNPEKTAPDACRASVGLRLNSPLSAEQLSCVGLQQSEIPAVDVSLVCPWRLASGILHLPSIIVGVTRVYGTAKREWENLIPAGIQKNASDICSCLELYDGNDIRFCFPLTTAEILKWTGPPVGKKEQ